MNGICLSFIVFVLLACGSAGAKEPYFPADIIDENAQRGWFPSSLYSRYLTAMNEPSLIDAGEAEVYRILWLRTFHSPMVFRLTVKSDGTADLVTKKTNGLEAGEPGRLVVDAVTNITNQDTETFLSGLERTNFWNLTTAEERRGFDGAYWLVEGVKGKKYHVVERWGGGDIMDWALSLMRKSGEDLRPIY